MRSERGGARRSLLRATSSASRAVCGLCRYMNASLSSRPVRSAASNAATTSSGVPAERLLAEDVLARLDGLDRPLAVERVRERDVDGVDVRVLEERLVGAVRARDAPTRWRTRPPGPGRGSRRATSSTFSDAWAPGMTSPVDIGGREDRRAARSDVIAPPAPRGPDTARGSERNPRRRRAPTSRFGSIVSRTRTQRRDRLPRVCEDAASATPASSAAPYAEPSSTSVSSSGTPRTDATISSQSRLRAPPPETRPARGLDAELAEQLERVAQAVRDSFEHGADECAAVVTGARGRRRRRARRGRRGESARPGGRGGRRGPRRPASTLRPRPTSSS